MSKRRKAGRGPTPAKCGRAGCSELATHLLVDPFGETVRSCSGCWVGLVLAIESLGGRVGDCSCRDCRGGPVGAVPASTGAPERAAVAGRSPNRGVPGRTAAGSVLAGPLRGPV